MPVALKLLLKLAAAIGVAGVIAVLVFLVPCIVMDGGLPQCGLRSEPSSRAAGQVLLWGFLGGFALCAPVFYFSELRRLLRG